MFILFWEMFHPKMYILPLIAVLNSRTKLQQTGSAFTHGSSTGQHSVSSARRSPRSRYDLLLTHLPCRLSATDFCA